MVEWVGRPAGQSRIRGPKVSCLPSLFSYFPKRKKDGQRRKKERERRSIDSIASCCMHAQALYGCEKASLSPPSLSPANPPLTIRTVEPGPGHQTGPDMPCCAAEPVYVRAGPGAIDRSPQPWDNVYYRSSCNRIRAIRGPTIFLRDFFSTGSPRIYIYIYISSILLRFHLSFIFFPRYFFEINLSQYFVYKRKGIIFFS